MPRHSSDPRTKSVLTLQSSTSPKRDSAYHWEARRRQMALDRRRHYQLQQEMKNKKIENDLEEQRYCMGLEPYQRYCSPSPDHEYLYDNESPETSHQNAGAYIAGQSPEDLRGGYMIPERRTMGHCMCQCQCHFQGQGQHRSRHQVQEEEQDEDQDEVQNVGQSKNRDRKRDLCQSKSQDRARTLGKGHRQSKSQVRDRDRDRERERKQGKIQCQCKEHGHHTGHHHHKIHPMGHQQAPHHPQEFKHSVPETLRHPKRGKRYTAMDYIQQW
ncbi:coiled-coil domain-containing protein 200 [Trichosurus vulpecula]|uniref:coiled-coil domain-containing protein 200 n=1 Tax=Trichosurus vulpecula TaxID=9337 RepID=UPI00186B3E3C|nr:coiled-coil domain-containing protein 200 [Trichosurus vulpecula]